MFLLGMMALFQSMALPGALILKVINFRGSFIQRLSYALGLSLIASFCGIFVLTLLGLYKQIVVIVLFSLQVVALLWIYRSALGEPILTALPQIWNRFARPFHDLVMPLNEDEAPSLAKLIQSVFRLVFFILAISVLWWAFKLILNYLGSIFTAWDAINSWNQWALTWANGAMPTYSHSYPQLIPANWSLTYIFMGSTKVQFFAMALMLCFTFLILLLFLDLGIETNKGGFFAGCVITYLLLKKFLLPQLTNGYVDVAVAFFATLTVYSLIKLWNSQDESQKPALLVLGAIFASGSAMVKQSGVYIFLLYFPLLYLGILRPLYNRHIQPHFTELTLAFVSASLLALPWYVYKFVAFQVGWDRPEIQELLRATSNDYDGPSTIAQMVAALTRFEKYIWLFPVILLGIAFLPALYRWLVLLFILPYPLIWSYLASYDTRNLAIWLPVFGMLAGLSLEELLLRSVALAENFRMIRLRVYIIPAVFMGILLVINHFLPASKLNEQQANLQMQAFSPQKNKMIYEIAAKEGPRFHVLTNYPVNYLPGLEGVKVNFGYQDYNDFLYRIKDPSIEYLLIPRVIDPQISAHIEQKLANGDYELVFENREWLYYRMIHMVKR